MFKAIFGATLFVIWCIFCYVMFISAYVGALIYLMKTMGVVL